MKKVLVTGASGFIGRHCLEPLLASGYEVHAVRLNPADLILQDITWHSEDLLDTKSIDRLVERIQPEFLLHLAWYAKPGLFWSAAENLDWVKSSIHLLKTFHRCGGRRAVFAGTCAEYEWGPEPCVEGKTPLVPSTLYGICKNALQQIYTAYTRQVGLSAAWGRIFHLYGPHEPRGRFVSSIITSSLAGVDARCTKGDQVRDFLHVSDVASAFVALLNSDVEGPVNIVSGQPVTLAQVATMIARKMNAENHLQLGAIPTPKNDPPVLVGSAQRLNEEVGWHPSLSLDQGLDDTVKWWRKQST